MGQKFDALKIFFESNSTCNKAVSLLSQGTEIGIVLQDGTQCALINSGTGPRFEPRTAESPDVIFNINDVAVTRLCQNIGAGPEDLAVSILKEIKNREISLTVVGSYLSIATRGYLSIIKLGGKKMWDYLSEHGFTNIFKITSLIKDMIKNR